VDQPIALREDKVGLPLEEHCALLSGGHIRAGVVANMDRAKDCFADRSLVGQPVCRVDKGHAIAFGSGIIFLKHRPPPINHRLFDRHRAGCGGVDRHCQRRNVITRAGRFGQFEHPHEMGGHELARAHLVILDVRERRLGIKFLHQNDGPTKPVN
jgi:hypothetical protein